MTADEMLVFGGSGSTQLTKRICEYLDLTPGASEAIRFSEGNIFVRILDSVRGKQVYLVQSTVFPANDNFMELLFWIDAFKRASAAQVTVLMPYFSYAKGDKKDEPRVSIRARVCADCIEVAGADRVVAMDLHAPQIQGFFRIPVDALYAGPTLCDAVREEGLEDLVVVAPDAGFAKMAGSYAHCLGVKLAIANKRRTGHEEKAEVMDIIGDVKGQTALIVDDFTISGGTFVSAAERLLEYGAREVYGAVTHAVFSTEAAMERIVNAPIRKLFITDTVENHPVRFCNKVQVVSVAHVFGEAIRRIHNRESISVLFPQ